MTEWTVNNKLNAWYQKRYHIKLPKEFETKSEIYFGGSSFSPSALFALAEPGVWFDPSDLTTLFTDPAGTTPVTTPGQTVGLMLDKSKGLALGAETVANPGNPFVSTTGYSAGGSATISVDTGRLKVSQTTGFTDGVLCALPNSTFTTTTVVSFDVDLGSSSFVQVQAGNGNFGSGNVITLNIFTSGTHSIKTTTLANGSCGLSFKGASAGDFFLSRVSVKSLAGNHATQATLAARPTYSIEPVGGRRNLLTFSEQFDNAVWAKAAGVTITTNTHAAPDGTVTADTLTSTANQLSSPFILPILASAVYTNSVYFRKTTGATYTPGMYVLFSGGTTAIYAAVVNTNTGVPTAVTAGGFSAPSNISVTEAGDYWRLSVSGSSTNNTDLRFVVYPNLNPATSAAGAGTQIIWGAQTELGSTATPYQRVTTQHDVTEAGVASVGYLFFDGAGDFMFTSTITPGTDKVQVFAGVRKLDDSSGIFAEFSSVVTTNNGSFALFGQPQPNPLRFISKGTVQAQALSGSIPSPSTNLLTAIGDISGDTSTLRVNGTQVSQATNDQGTGNYLAYPLFIGSRGNAGPPYTSTSVPFLGHLYSLITRFGPTLDAPTIASTETWVAGKTGFYTPIITGVPTIGVS